MTLAATFADRVQEEKSRRNCDEGHLLCSPAKPFLTSDLQVSWDASESYISSDEIANPFCGETAAAASLFGDARRASRRLSETSVVKHSNQFGALSPDTAFVRHASHRNFCPKKDTSDRIRTRSIDSLNRRRDTDDPTTVNRVSDQRRLISQRDTVTSNNTDIPPRFHTQDVQREMVRDNLRLKQDIEDLKAKLEKAEQEQVELKSSLVESMARKHERRVILLKEEYDFHLDQQKEAHQKDLEAAKARESDLVQQLEEAKKHVHEVIMEATLHKETVDSLNDELRRAREEKTELLNHREANLKTVSQFSDRSSELSKSLEETKLQVAKLEGELQLTSSKLKERDAELHEAVNRSSHSDALAKSLESEAAKLRKELEFCKNELLSREKEFLAHKTKESQWQSQISAVTSRLNDVQKKLDAANAAVERMNEKLAESKVRERECLAVANAAWHEVECVKTEAHVLREQLASRAKGFMMLRELASKTDALIRKRQSLEGNSISCRIPSDTAGPEKYDAADKILETAMSISVAKPNFEIDTSGVNGKCASASSPHQNYGKTQSPETISSLFKTPSTAAEINYDGHEGNGHGNDSFANNRAEQGQSSPSFPSEDVMSRFRFPFIQGEKSRCSRAAAREFLQAPSAAAATDTPAPISVDAAAEALTARLHAPNNCQVGGGAADPTKPLSRFPSMMTSALGLDNAAAAVQDFATIIETNNGPPPTTKKPDGAVLLDNAISADGAKTTLEKISPNISALLQVPAYYPPSQQKRRSVRPTTAAKLSFCVPDAPQAQPKSHETLATVNRPQEHQKRSEMYFNGTADSKSDSRTSSSKEPYIGQERQQFYENDGDRHVPKQGHCSDTLVAPVKPFRHSKFNLSKPEAAVHRSRTRRKFFLNRKSQQLREQQLRDDSGDSAQPEYVITPPDHLGKGSDRPNRCEATSDYLGDYGENCNATKEAKIGSDQPSMEQHNDGLNKCNVFPKISADISTVETADSSSEEVAKLRENLRSRTRLVKVNNKDGTCRYELQEILI